MQNTWERNLEVRGRAGLHFVGREVGRREAVGHGAGDRERLVAAVRLVDADRLFRHRGRGRVEANVERVEVVRDERGDGHKQDVRVAVVVGQPHALQQKPRFQQ